MTQPRKRPSPSDFAHVHDWVFDLDNTLYPHHINLFAQIDKNMTAFVADLLQVDPVEAKLLQKRYYHEHGTTLAGLMLHHNVDPNAFLEKAHAIDYSMLLPDEALGNAIKRLPGRKFIFTNGTVAHAEDAARALGILDHFDDIFDIVAAGFTPKPERSTYELFLAKHAVDPGRAAMFEDIEKNLLVPSELGMKTVLIIPQTPDPFREAWEQAAVEAGHVHHVTSDLTGFLTPLARG